MKNIIKALSLLSIFAVIPGLCSAASPRVGMKTATRLPSIAGYIMSNTGVTTVSTTGTATSSSTTWSDVDCINNYTDCITAEDACGANFEECTTNVLFHAQMPKCLSVVYQCSASGINSLFGTSSVTALSNVASTKTDGGVTEVTRYTYPTDGSVLGQRIIGGSIANQFTTDQCVRRYTSCLHRDDICGQDFELCTSMRDFKKQAVLCASTLARCQNDAKKELFGSVENASALNPSGDGARLKALIEDGQQLAAMNAVKTCQRVTDNCLVSACLANPWRCVEGTSMAKIGAADFIGSATSDKNTKTSKIGKGADGATMSDADLTALTGSDIRKTLKAQCLDTVGANKYCHMTYREKSPNNKELMDIDLQEDVFSLAYAARKEYINTKIQEELKKFDTNAKDACIETISSCAMRSCGGGIGSVCFSQARSGSSASGASAFKRIGAADNSTAGINVNGNPYNDIKAGCEAIVNTDPNCIYAATATSAEGYNYTYMDKTTFEKLFTKADDTSAAADPIGAVAYLNSVLATSYNDAAIENMRKQCQTVALSCVKSMCGKDYENCYRARTDVMAGTYSADGDGAKFANSMNKMGGVLDYNIVIGLCMNTMKTSSVCEEHLKVAVAKLTKDTKSWGGADSVRNAWKDANSTTVSLVQNADQIVVGCTVSNPDNKNCPEGIQEEPDDNGNCIGIMDENGCIYDKPVTKNIADYKLDAAGTTLFQELLADVEREAQAKYNAKLTKEQHTCLANNNGGIMGAAENGSTFMWVKLKSNKIPKNYNMKGLTAKQFTASNDLYGSFCRARITVTSDDKMIQKELGDAATAYFAVGDAFTCGSWIDDGVLTKISQKVAARELCKQGYGVLDEKGECDTSKLSTKEKLAYAWGTVAPALAGGALGVGLTESGVLGKWLDKAGTTNSNKANQKQDKSLCVSYANEAIKLATADGVNADDAASDAAKSQANAAKGLCDSIYASEKDEKKTTYCPEIGTKNSEIASNLKIIRNSCDSAPDKRVNNGKENSARWAVPVATTLAGGALGAGITASIMKSKKENIQNEEAQKWMDEVGEHIQCYLGADELGTYGDVVSFTIE